MRGVKGLTAAATTATPQLARRINADAVLRFVWSAPVVTVTDVMAATGLTRATAHAVCGDLVELGWVRELPPRRIAGTRTGRPAKRFVLAADAGYVLGVDIGEHSVKVALADLRGAVVAQQAVSGLTALTTSASRLRHVGMLTRGVLEQAPARSATLLAAAVGVAAPVDQSGRIGFHHRSLVPYDQGFRMEPDELASVIGGCPTLLCNDANLAVLAERWKGQARGVDNVVALLSSERLGAGLVEGGRLLHGRNGEAGEMYFLDHVVGVGAAHGVAFLARLWAAEAMVAGRATTLRAAARAGDGQVTAEMVFAEAAKDDAVARQILDRLADRLARVCAVLGTLLNPELVVVCGGAASAMQQLVDPVTQRLQALTYAPPRVACSTLGESVVTTGAIRLALDHVVEHALDSTPTGELSATT